MEGMPMREEGRWTKSRLHAYHLEVYRCYAGMKVQKTAEFDRDTRQFYVLSAESSKISATIAEHLRCTYAYSMKNSFRARVGKQVLL